MKMSKEEFKRRWELNDAGDGISFGDIADCYEDWFGGTARTRPILVVRYMVLKAADTSDAEEYNPQNEEA